MAGERRLTAEQASELVFSWPEVDDDFSASDSEGEQANEEDEWTISSNESDSENSTEVESESEGLTGESSVSVAQTSAESLTSQEESTSPPGRKYPRRARANPPAPARRGPNPPVPARRGRTNPRAPTRRARTNPPPDVWEEVGGQSSTSQNFRLPAPRAAGLRANLQADCTALDCFKELCPLSAVDELVKAANNYASIVMSQRRPLKRHSRLWNWVNVTAADIYKYFMILIAIGLDKRPRIADYWSTTPNYHTSWYHEQFSRNRFELLHHTMLHCTGTQSSSKAKIEPFINKLLVHFQRAFYPFKNVAIDEMVIGWKGRFANKTYNASKPKKYHVKTFGLCDSATGYIVNLLVYFGKNTSYCSQLTAETDSAMKVFETLLKPLGPGHHIFADRFYTTKNLINHLLQKNMHYTGTLQINCRGFPPQLKTIRLAEQESKFYLNEGKKQMVVVWRGKKAKKPCIAVSTDSDNSVRRDSNRRGAPISKPTLIHQYNLSMNGCDRADQALTYYGQFERKTSKWWKKIFHWLLEVVQLNAHILFCLAHKKKVPLHDFKQALIDDFQKATGPTTFTSPRRSASFAAASRPDARHLIKWVESERRCAVCSTPQVRRRTNFICSGCPDHPHLHPKTCFEKHHNK